MIDQEKFDLVINATPLGMRPDDQLPFDPSSLSKSTLVVNVITKPEFTPLLLRAREIGHQVQTGRHMHRGQAVACVKFFGFDLDA
jgi:shikimate dehydrogenase